MLPHRGRANFEPQIPFSGDFLRLSSPIGSPLALEGSMSAGTGTLTVNNKQIELPIKDGTIGPSVVDIAKLYAQTGMFTYDPQGYRTWLFAAWARMATK